VLLTWASRRVLYYPEAQSAPTLSTLPSRAGMGMDKAALSEEVNSFWVGSGDFSS